MRWLGFSAFAAIFILDAGGCFVKTNLAAPEDDPQDQWSRGVWLYSSNCASCHGENGEGRDDVPAIAGAGALPRSPVGESDRRVKLDTAADLFGYVKQSMPPLDVGCLSDEQVYAVMNYVLKQAEVPFSGDVTADNVATIKLR